jgi:hypothetical protein
MKDRYILVISRKNNVTNFSHSVNRIYLTSKYPYIAQLTGVNHKGNLLFENPFDDRKTDKNWSVAFFNWAYVNEGLKYLL